MNKKILLIGYNFYPELTGIGKYSGEMMHWLARKGYECTVITAYPYYPHWQVQEPYTKKKFSYTTEKEQFASGGSLSTVRCPMYIPATPSGLKRILLDFTFLTTALFKLLQLAFNQRFDVVFVVAPAFHFGLLGIICKKLTKAKFVYHIQDMQIEAARDLRMIKSEWVVNFLFRMERYIFAQADIISSISVGMLRKIQAKADKKVFSFPNWTDTNLFYPIQNKAVLKEEFGFKPTEKIVLYSGAIGEKQGLEAIIQVAHDFIDQQAIKFIICGSGPYKETLQKMANELKLTNIIFFPLQPFEKFNKFLNAADIHLVIQKANASDLVMPSKITTILAIGGLSIITANPDSSLYELVQQRNIGILVPAENQAALSEAIEEALALPDDSIAKNARTYAENFLAIDKIMESFEQEVFA